MLNVSIVFISHSESIKLNDNAEMGVIFSRVDFPRIPRKLVNTLFSRQILILVLMYPMAYGSFRFAAMSSFMVSFRFNTKCGQDDRGEGTFFDSNYSFVVGLFLLSFVLFIQLGDILILV